MSVKTAGFATPTPPTLPDRRHWKPCDQRYNGNRVFVLIDAGRVVDVAQEILQEGRLAAIPTADAARLQAFATAHAVA